MPTILHKVPIADDLRKSLPKPCIDLVLGSGEANAGLLHSIYSLIGEAAGSVELAYRRGFELGHDEGYKLRDLEINNLLRELKEKTDE